MDRTAAYALARTRVSELVRAVPAEQLATPTRACPGWTVRDVVAHLVGGQADVAAQRLEKAGSPEWTQPQVDARRDHTLEEILAEWAETAGPAERGEAPWPDAVAPFVLADVLLHEQDIRDALDAPGARDAPGAAESLEMMGSVVDARLTKQGLGPLRAVAVAEDFEVFRAIAGRRSARQVRAWEWKVDPEPYLPLLNIFGPLPEQDIAN